MPWGFKWLWWEQSGLLVVLALVSHCKILLIKAWGLEKECKLGRRLPRCEVLVHRQPFTKRVLKITRFQLFHIAAARPSTRVNQVCPKIIGLKEAWRWWKMSYCSYQFRCLSRCNKHAPRSYCYIPIMSVLCDFCPAARRATLFQVQGDSLLYKGLENPLYSFPFRMDQDINPPASFKSAWL